MGNPPLTHTHMAVGCGSSQIDEDIKGSSSISVNNEEKTQRDADHNTLGPDSLRTLKL